jgi:hypothetical protein
VTKPNIVSSISQWDLQQLFGIKASELNKYQLYLIAYLYIQTLELKVPSLEVDEDSFDEEEPKIIIK